MRKNDWTANPAAVAAYQKALEAEPRRARDIILATVDSARSKDMRNALLAALDVIEDDLFGDGDSDHGGLGGGASYTDTEGGAAWRED